MYNRDWLIRLRKNKGETQINVSQRVQISHQYYSRIENGTRNPSTTLAKKIADALGFDWTKFYE